MSTNEAVGDKKENEESKAHKNCDSGHESDDPDAPPRPKFIFGSSTNVNPFKRPVSTNANTTSATEANKQSVNPAKTVTPKFSFTFKPSNSEASFGKKSADEESKVRQPAAAFGSTFNIEAKLFVNKNLFANPMVASR